MRSPSSAAVIVHCLGDFSLRVRGQSVDRWRAGKARSLFQYLLINQGRVVHRDKLHEVLWPDSAWSPRSSSVKVAMHALRQILNESSLEHIGPADGADTGRPAVQILYQDQGYLLKAHDIWVDVEEFESLCNAGHAADLRGDHSAAVHGYRRAVDLYTGDFLAAETTDWVREQQEWNKSLMLRALKYLLHDALCREDFPTVITLCRRMLDVDPYQEDVYRTLMLVHGELGQLGRVKSWYELCSRRMCEELGLGVTDDTRRVLERTLGGRVRVHVGGAP